MVNSNHELDEVLLGGPEVDHPGVLVLIELCTDHLDLESGGLLSEVVDGGFPGGEVFLVEAGEKGDCLHGVRIPQVRTICTGPQERSSTTTRPSPSSRAPEAAVSREKCSRSAA
ncbi:hypothetical protein EB118_18215 [bacterium]|nr:hypothetical protein [bacterium]